MSLGLYIYALSPTVPLLSHWHMAPTTPSTLSASYASPATTKTFTHTLPSASVTSTKEKTAYLAAVRKSVVQLQEEVNGFLTIKMEEDKILSGEGGAKVDDKAEEENYGEENVEEG